MIRKKRGKLLPQKKYSKLGETMNTLSQDPEKMNKGSKTFNEVVIILSEKYADQKDRFALDKVIVLIAKSSICSDIISQIDKESESTLYLLHTGLLEMAHFEKYQNCNCFLPPSSSLSLVVPDHKCLSDCLDKIKNVEESLRIMVKDINKYLNSGSACNILPPPPPTFIDICSISDHTLFHYLVHKEREIEYYIATYIAVNHFRALFTIFSKTMISLSLSIYSQLGMSKRAFEKYDRVTSNWNHHITPVTYEKFATNDKECYSKYKVWLNTVTDFINDCTANQNASVPLDIGKAITDKSKPICPRNNSDNANNSSKCQQDDFNNSNRSEINILNFDTQISNNLTKKSRAVDQININSKQYDHLVLISFSQEIFYLLPFDLTSKSISTIILKSSFDLNEVNNKLDSIKLLSKKNILFVICMSILLVSDMFDSFHCTRSKCSEILSLLRSGILATDKLVHNKMNDVRKLILDIEKHFPEKSDVILIPLPALCAEFPCMEHEKLHNSLRGKDRPYIVVGAKQRWNQIGKLLKELCKKEMNIIQDKAPENLKAILSQSSSLAKNITLLYWVDLKRDSIESRPQDFENCRSFLKGLKTVLSTSADQKILQSSFSESVILSTSKTECNNFSNDSEICDLNQTIDTLLDSKISGNFFFQTTLGTDDSITSNIQKSTVLIEKCSEDSFSNLVLDLTKVEKRNNVPFKHVYILGKSELSSLLVNTNGENVKFIQCQQSEVTEKEIPTLIKKYGDLKSNSVCFLALDLLFLTEKKNVLTSCKQLKCETPIPVMNLDVDEDADIIAVNSYLLRKIMDLISFVTKLSFFIPVIMMPIFPSRIFCKDDFLDTNHKLVHSINKPDSYVVEGKKKKWETFGNVASTLWMNVMKSNNEKYFLAQDFLKFIKESYKCLTIEDNVSKYSSPCSDILKWGHILDIFLQILVVDASEDGILSESEQANVGHKQIEKEIELSTQLNRTNYEQTEKTSLSVESSSQKLFTGIQTLSNDKEKSENACLELSFSTPYKKFLVIIWNCLNCNEERIINLFKDKKVDIVAHKYDDHFQIDIFKGKRKDIHDIIDLLKIFDDEIKVCVIEENEFFSLNYKTLKCDGNCQGQRESCFYYHDDKDKRRASTFGNVYCYNSILCQFALASVGCSEGDLCISSHNKVEINFHPTKYQSSLCAEIKTGLCRSQPWCFYAHENTPEIFYTTDWEDLVTFGTENSLKYIIGAIRGFRKMESLPEKKIILLISPSPKFLNIVKSVLLNLLNGSQIKIILLEENPVVADNYEVFLGTLENITNHNWGLITRKDVRALIVDDVMSLMYKSDARLLLTSVIQKLKDNEVINKVFVSDIYDSETTEYLTDILRIPLKEVKNNDLSKLDSSIMKFEKTFEKEEKTFLKSYETDLIYSKRLRSQSISSSEDEELHSMESYSRSPKTRKKRSRSKYCFYSSSKNFPATCPGKTFRVHSRSPNNNSLSRSRSRSNAEKRRRRSDSQSKFCLITRKSPSWELRSRSKSNESYSKSPVRISQLNFRNQRSLSKDNDRPHDKFQSVCSFKSNSSSAILENKPFSSSNLNVTIKEYSKSNSSCLSSSTLKSKPSTSTNLNVTRKEEFSVDQAITILELICPNLGILGPAISEIMKCAREFGVNSIKTLKLFADEENIILLQMVVDKLRVMLVTASPSDLLVYSKAVTWITKLLNYAKNPPHSGIKLNLNSIAIASKNESAPFTLNMIKNAFAYEGRQNPTIAEINDAFLKVRALHFEMTLEEN